MANRKALGGTLVLGGGFAGGYVARLLGKHGATVVSRENFMLYTPLLPEAASGTLEPRHVVVPLRMMCPHSEVVLGRAVDLKSRADAMHLRNHVLRRLDGASAAPNETHRTRERTFLFVGAGYAGV